MVERIEQLRPDEADGTPSSSRDRQHAINDFSHRLLTGDGTTHDTSLHSPDNAQAFIENREARHGILTGPDAIFNINRITIVSHEDSETLLSTIGKGSADYTDEQRNLLALWESRHEPLTKGTKEGYIQRKLLEDYLTARETLEKNRAPSHQHYIDGLSLIFAKHPYQWTSGERQAADYWTSQGGKINAKPDTIRAQLEQMDWTAQNGSIEFAEKTKMEERQALEAARNKQIADLISSIASEQESGDNNTSMSNAIRSFTQRRLGN